MNKRIALLAVAAAALVLGAPAGASAAKIREATFLVQVEGTQSVKWSTSHEIQFDCDVNIAGGGTETTRFKSRKVRIKLSKYGKLDPLFFHPKGDIPLRARTTRQGKIDTWGGKVCSSGDGTGGTAPEPPDCGTKTSVARVELRYAYKNPNLLMLGRGTGNAKSPFKNCPWGGVSWPSLLTYAGKQPGGVKDIGQKVPVKELLSPAFKKHIILGRGTYDETWTDTSATTKVRWELTLTRVGGKSWNVPG